MEAKASLFDIAIFLSFALLALCAISYILLRAFKNAKAVEITDKAQIYVRQLSDIEKDLTEGKIDESEFQGAKNEILKRILRAKSQEQKPLFPTTLKPKIPLFFVIFIASLSAIIYFFTGMPFMKDLPASAREAALLKRAPETLSQNEVLLILESRANKEPNDAMPHLLIGKILMGEGRAAEALHAFQASLRRDNKNAETYAEIAGALLELNGGQIDKDFVAAINASLSLDRSNLTAQFYQGLGFWKSGQKEQALKFWNMVFMSISPTDLRRNALIERVGSEISKLEIGPNTGSGAPMMDAMAQGTNPQDFIKTMIGNRMAKLQAAPNDIGLRLSVINVLSKTDMKMARQVVEDGKKYHQTILEKALLADAAQRLDAFANSRGQK